MIDTLLLKITNLIIEPGKAQVIKENLRTWMIINGMNGNYKS